MKEKSVLNARFVLLVLKEDLIRIGVLHQLMKELNLSIATLVVISLTKKD